MKNKAEEFVFHICKKTFLSLWSHANPLGKAGKELCDLLVVCEPDIVIFSVKEIMLTESKDVQTDWKRWNRRAIEESAGQVYGAERWLKTATHVIKNDGSPGIKLPARDEQRIHRIVVALGGKDKVPMFYGDLGKGFVHVLDEISFRIILKELDTVSDFINYFTAKERFYMAGKVTPFLAGEENLLALYLHSDKKLPENYTTIVIEGEVWNSFKKKPEYLRKKEEDKISYLWDDLIEDISKNMLRRDLRFSRSPDDGEVILRIMAREDRFSRRILGKSFAEFIRQSSKSKIRSTMLPSPSGVIYVLLALPHTIDREYRRSELRSRCFIARGLNLDCKTVIGIATEQSKPGIGHSFDLYYLSLLNWTEEHQKQMESLQKGTGFFVNPVKREAHEDEYPNQIINETRKMRVHKVLMGNVEATAIENSPIGDFCIAPMVIEKESLLSEKEKLLVTKKADLLCELLLDEPFLKEVRDLYGDQFNIPPLIICFGRFLQDEKGAGFHGKTSDSVVEIGRHKGRLIELNLLDADDRVLDAERLLSLWAGLLSLLLCHSPRRPKEIKHVIDWSDSEAKRAWLLALRRGKLKNPHKKYVIGLERIHIVRARPTPIDPKKENLIITFPIHFRTVEGYRCRIKRGQEHLFPDSNWDDKYDYFLSPPWRWNNTAGFVDVYESQGQDLIADIHIATTWDKIKRYKSVEPATASATSGKIFRFFNNIKWEEALIEEPNDKLEIFLELLATYVEKVFGWYVNINPLQKLTRRIGF